MEGLFSKAELATVQAPIAALPECGKCGLYKGCRSPKMPVAGDGRCRVLVVGEAPGENEDKQGRPFVGAAGELVRAALRRGGLSLFEDCWVTNALSCRPPDNKIKNEMSVDYCRPLVIKAIEELQPEIIILLGLRAVRSVIGYLWRDGIGTMERWAGFQIPCRKWNAWICPTYHPAHIMRNRNDEEKINPVKEAEFHDHVEAAAQLSGRPWAAVPDYDSRVRIEMDDQKVWEAIDAFDGRSPLAFDYETTTLKPHGPHAEIVCCSLSDGKDFNIAFPWYGKAISAMKVLLHDPDVPKISQNLQMEDSWTRVHLGIPVAGWEWDTMTTSHGLDARSHTTGLKFQAFTSLGVEDYSASIAPFLKPVRGTGDNAPNRIRDIKPLSKLLMYCGLDSLFEALIARKQKRSVYDDA